MKNIEDKLDLQDFIGEFKRFFARPKELKFEGDVERHLQFIQSLEEVEFKEPPEVEELWKIVGSIRKFGILSLGQIFQVVKIVRYFTYLKTVRFSGISASWIEKITVPEYFVEIDSYFDKDGNLKDEVDERLLSISLGIKEVKDNINSVLYQLLHSHRVEEYLVDKQIHFINETQTLLMRGGFNHILKGNVIGRTGAGFFYVAPDNITKLLKQSRDYQQEKELIYLEYRKNISKRFQPSLPFIKFIDKEFDKFDHYQARLFFAKSKNLEFIIPEKSSTIILKDFYHPAIKQNPKPLNVDFSKSALMVTGVNAGGKTMLLKSVLSSVYLSKNLIPMKIDTHNSRIGRFKGIEAVIDDPQNVNFDISTFAGRMVSFSDVLHKDRFLIGVDEIELGTDSDEASALFKVLIEKIIKNGSKIVITTHHKRLASLMGTNPEVELVAALYDEERREPTYRFLQGIVGKSYAFETAERYGIPKVLVDESRIIYGNDNEKLNELIEKGANLEQKLIEKNEKLDKKLIEVESEKRALEFAKEKFYSGLENKKSELQNIYKGAISEAKSSIVAKTVPDTHRHMTKAHKQLPKNYMPDEKKAYSFKVGDLIRYKQTEGIILQLKKKSARVEINGMRIELALEKLKPALKLKREILSRVSVKTEKPDQASLRLDLHGKRREEALEELDHFLSNALLQGWDEVYIIHGIGGGILAKAVVEFLKLHPRVEWFGDAPPNQGGQGSKLVRL